MRLKELREKENLTQEEFAKKYNITRATYANYESGKTQPDFEILKQLANIHNVSVDYLIENNCKNLIDLSNISETKKNLIKKILELPEQDCNTIEGIIIGYFNGYKTKSNEINHNIFFRGNK